MEAATHLLQQVRELELVARKNAAGIYAGNYETSLPGRGMVFREARKYIAGDSVKDIDWNITGRMGEPYVRVFQDERERELMVCLDVSASMQTGFQEYSKLEFAVLLAATLLVSADRSRDCMGLCAFSDEVHSFSPPGRGRKQLYILLEELVSWQQGPSAQKKTAATDIRSAIKRLEERRKGRYVIFFISDFLDHDVHEDFRYLRRTHDVSLLHIYDPLEYEPSPLFFQSQSPEGNSSAVFKPGSVNLKQFQNNFNHVALRSGMAAASFSTAEPAGLQLGKFLNLRRALLARQACI